MSNEVGHKFNTNDPFLMLFELERRVERLDEIRKMEIALLKEDIAEIREQMQRNAA